MILKKNITTIIFVATILRCIVALSINLGNDEVYYISYAQHFQWNYFDHPPMVGLLIKLTTLDLFLNSDFFIRLGPIVLAAINTYFIYLIAKKIKDENSGLIAAMLFTTSIYSSIIAGLFIMPDSPQLFFWILSIYLLVEIISDKKSKLPQKYTLLLFGLMVGLCTMSKVHGVFLWVGYGLYILIYDRKILANPFLYFSLLVTVLVISPILFWNINNDFITYNFHSERVAITNKINIDSFIREFFGGILYNNPLNYFLLVSCLIACWQRKIFIEKKHIRLLLLLSLPLIGTLLFVSFFKDTLPHWSGPAFTSLIILSACYLSTAKPLLQKLVTGSAYLIVSVCFLGIIVIQFFPGTLGNKTDKKLGEGDVTIDMYDWAFFKEEINKIQQSDKKYHRTQTNFIVSNKWFPAAHIDHYIAQPLQMDLTVIGELQDIHTYYWLNQYRKQLKTNEDAYFITFSSNFKDPNEKYSSMFKKINKPRIIKQYRGEKPVRNMLVYLMEDYIYKSKNAL